MGKKSLSEDQMSAAEYVDRAAQWSRDLTRFRSRGSGDLENAMRAIERDYGIDYWVQWRLRYRKQSVKSLCVSIYARLAQALQAEIESQQRKLKYQARVAELMGISSPVLDEAKALVCDENSESET